MGYSYTLLTHPLGSHSCVCIKSVTCDLASYKRVLSGCRHLLKGKQLSRRHTREMILGKCAYVIWRRPGVPAWRRRSTFQWLRLPRFLFSLPLFFVLFSFWVWRDYVREHLLLKRLRCLWICLDKTGALVCRRKRNLVTAYASPVRGYINKAVPWAVSGSLRLTLRRGRERPLGSGRNTRVLTRETREFFLLRLRSAVCWRPLYKYFR